MEKVFILVWALAGAAVASAQDAPAPCVRQIDCVAVTLSGDGCEREVQSIFMLYIGSPETERLDACAERCDISRGVCLTHPAGPPEGPGGLSGVGAGASSRSRWRVTETDTEAGIVRRGVLLSPAVWTSLPLIVRQSVLALGPDDERLILVSFNGISGSLSIYYDPAVQSDRAFHEARLEVLRSYLAAHAGEDAPYERIDPAGAVGGFTAL
jgi:hypothetical protein